MTSLTPAAQEVRETTIVRLYLDGENARSIAPLVGVTPRTVERILARRGVRSPRAPRRVDRAYLLQLMHDGMPANWAAETIGFSSGTVEQIARAMLPQRREFVREWDRVWAEIRHDEDLIRLHDELCPKT